MHSGVVFASTAASLSNLLPSPQVGKLENFELCHQYLEDRPSLLNQD